MSRPSGAGVSGSLAAVGAGLVVGALVAGVASSPSSQATPPTTSADATTITIRVVVATRLTLLVGDDEGMETATLPTLPAAGLRSWPIRLNADGRCARGCPPSPTPG